MKKIKNKSNLIIFILFVVTLFFMSMGFAAYNKILNLNGTAIVQPDGKIYLKSVRLTQSRSSSASPEINATTGMIEFNLKFTTNKNNEDDYLAVFEIVMANESSYDYVYTVPNYRPTASKNGTDYSGYVDYSIDGITSGHVIPSKTEKTFTISFTFKNPDKNSNGTYIIGGGFVPDLTEDTSATLRGVVDESQTGDLTGSNELALYSMSVMNTYNVPKTFAIIADSEKFETRNLTNTGTPQYTIDANVTEEVFTFYLRKIENSEFVSNSEKVRINIVPSGATQMHTGRVTALVDKTVQEYQDTTPPQVSNVTATIQNSDGTVDIRWDGEDDSGEVQNYTIICFNSSGTEVSRRTTSSDVEEYTYTGLSAGTYYFTVFGTDPTGNSASQSDITSATTNEGNACRSNQDSYRWKFNVTNSSNSNVKYTGTTGTNVVNRGDTYTATVRAANSSDYYDPTSGNVSVTMGGSDCTFEYDPDSGLITVPNVTGDLVITATVQEKTFCLVKGTKILLANGKYKNIENIQYTDLLKVYNHVTGKFTEVYPIWIEQNGLANKYRKITFSDGSILKIVNSHSLFDVDKKRYIDASIDSECEIGTRVYKVKNNNLEIVTIINIEDIEETVSYYSVVSTSYYNIIANNILTTDTTSSISNIYGFKENAIYGDNYNIISNGEKLEYKDINFIPYYLYKGLNLQNAKCLLNNELDINFLNLFISEHTLNMPMKNGKRCFIITTSLDNVVFRDVEKNMYEEGSIYKIPDIHVKGFMDTATGDIYEPGSIIKVQNSMHLTIIPN